jgi:exosortase
MTSSPARAPARSFTPLLPAVAALGCLVWAFWSTFADLAHTWASNDQYSHGFLVPGFALLLLWMRRDRLDGAARPAFLAGGLLLAAGIALRLAGVWYYYVWLDPISLLPCLAGLVWMLGGRAAWRWAWPAVLFLAFMIPLPYRLASALSGPLQNVATVVSTFLMQALGLPALAEGNVILLNEARIGVVEACSGLRMLVVFVALATALVLVTQRHWVDKVILLVSAVPIALVSNILRITATGILHETTGSEAANAFFHDLGGWLMMPLALLLLAVELKILSRLFIDVPAPVRTVRGPVPVVRRKRPQQAARTRQPRPAPARPPERPPVAVNPGERA